MTVPPCIYTGGSPLSIYIPGGAPFLYIYGGGSPSLYIHPGGGCPLSIYTGGPLSISTSRGGPPFYIYSGGGSPLSIYTSRGVAPLSIYSGGGPPLYIYIPGWPPSIYRYETPYARARRALASVVYTAAASSLGHHTGNLHANYLSCIFKSGRGRCFVLKSGLGVCI